MFARPLPGLEFCDRRNFSPVPPSNPELLQGLATHFIDSGFDLKELVRAITRSSAYQLSATPNKLNISDRQNYSRYYPRRLPAEVMLDSIDQLAGTQTDFANLPAGTRAVALPDNSYNRSSPFLRVFGRPEGESVCECERSNEPSITQALHLMNSPEIAAKIRARTGAARKLADSDKKPAAVVDELFLAALGRRPNDAERTKLLDAFTDGDRRAAVEDVVWALLNSKEFLYNR